MNRFFVSGIVTKDPVLNAFNKTGKYCTFSVANNVKQKHKDEWIDKDTYFSIVSFGNQAELVKNNVAKGDSVSCECEILDGSYKKDGQNVFKYSFVLKSISYQPKKKQTNKRVSNNIEQEVKQDVKQNNIINDDEIPF